MHAAHSLILALQARLDEEYTLDPEETADGEADGEGPTASGSGLPWDGSDRDYLYEELLGDAALGVSPGCVYS